jgi:MaoC like domain
MSTFRHLFRQGPVIRSLIEIGVLAGRGGGSPGAAFQAPGPVVEQTVPARSPDLIADYLRHVGGDPAWYKGRVPAHLFSQWGFPLLSGALKGVPYDMTRILNAGFRLDIRAPLPAGEPLNLRGQLAAVDDDGRRALLTQKLWTGTASTPDAVEATVTAIIPLKKSKDDAPKKRKKEPVRVPIGAREIARWRLPKNAGRAFAMLTGDINPLHWVPPYARAAGFKNVILHGFSTAARAIESLNRAVFSGDVDRLRMVEVRFVKPLVLPAQPRVFLAGNEFFVADAPGGPAYVTGTFEMGE